LSFFQVHDLQRENLSVSHQLGTVSKDFEDISHKEDQSGQNSSESSNTNSANKPIFSLQELRDILQVIELCNFKGSLE